MGALSGAVSVCSPLLENESIKFRVHHMTPKSKNAVARVWGIAKVLLFVLPIVGLGSLNVLTLVDDATHTKGVGLLRSVLAPFLADAAFSSLLSQSPTQKYSNLERSHKTLEARHVALRRVSATRSQVVKDISTKIGRRAIANAAKNVGSYAAEIIPVLGVAAITALTISDLYDDCQTLKDLNEINVSFEHDAEDETKVCGIKFP